MAIAKPCVKNWPRHEAFHSCEYSSPALTRFKFWEASGWLMQLSCYSRIYRSKCTAVTFWYNIRCCNVCFQEFSFLFFFFFPPSQHWPAVENDALKLHAMITFLRFRLILMFVPLLHCKQLSVHRSTNKTYCWIRDFWALFSSAVQCPLVFLLTLLVFLVRSLNTNLHDLCCF